MKVQTQDVNTCCWQAGGKRKSSQKKLPDELGVRNIIGNDGDDDGDDDVGGCG